MKRKYIIPSMIKVTLNPSIICQSPAPTTNNVTGNKTQLTKERGWSDDYWEE